MLWFTDISENTAISIFSVMWLNDCLVPLLIALSFVAVGNSTFCSVDVLPIVKQIRVWSHFHCKFYYKRGTEVDKTVSSV